MKMLELQGWSGPIIPEFKINGMSPGPLFRSELRGIYPERFKKSKGFGRTACRVTKETTG